MANLLSSITTYLRSHVPAGTNVYYNEMPDDQENNVLVQEVSMGGHVFPQIDAELHNIKVTVRALTSSAAESLARTCYTHLYDETGCIQLAAGDEVVVELRGTPIWEQTDQQGRRFFYFLAVVISKRLN